MIRRQFLKQAGLGAAGLSMGFNRCGKWSFPNIVVILADDLGYGDLSCLNPDSRLNAVFSDVMAGALQENDKKMTVLSGGRN